MRKVVKFGIIVMLSSLLVGCKNIIDPSKETRNYSDYKEFNLKIENFYNATVSDYYVYCYREDCPDCVPLKGYVLDYLDEFKENKKDTILYLVEFHNANTDLGRVERSKFKVKPDDYKGNNSEIKKLTKEMLGATKIDETFFFGTPSLYHIFNGALKNCFIGSASIKKVIN